MSHPRVHYLALAALVALPGACVRKTVSFNSKDEVPLFAGPVRGDSLTTTARKDQPKLSIAGKKAVLSKEEEKAAKDQEKAAQRKKTKVRKNVFLGDRIKRAYVKTGTGKNTVIDVFYYLRTFKQPSEQAPAVYYYSTKKHKIFKATGPLDPATDKVLHGPYKQLQNNKTLATGYYANGTRHLRWEKFDVKGSLLAKVHYEMGFPRDANISYYDAGQTMIKEVVPYVNGKMEGDYVKYTIEGKREWTGKFENDHRVGEWTNFWDYKNYRHYVYQYGDSGYEPEAEPELVREYSHGGTVIFDKEKKIDKRGEAEADSPANDPRRPGSHSPTPASKPGTRKPAADPRRPGYHPKPTTPPPATTAPAGTAPAGTAPTKPTGQ